jgi:general secretion pathway protein G
MNRHASRRLSNAQLRQAQRGMTLLEIMIVVAILGLLATVVVTNVMGQFDNAKIKTTQIKINDIQSTVNQYYTMVGDYPDSMSQLISPPDGLRPFFKNMPKDAWNKPFIYKRTSGADPFKVFSVGPDGQKGTKDDVHPKKQ